MRPILEFSDHLLRIRRHRDIGNGERLHFVSNAIVRELKGHYIYDSNEKPSTAFANCLSRDCYRDRDMAKIVDDKDYRAVAKALRSINAPVGGVACIWSEDKMVYNLIVRERDYHKCTYEIFEKCCKVMRQYAQIHRIDEIAMPLYTAMDGLEWYRVS